jgi:peptidyl-prolyl cis-trans isomerase C
MKTTQGAKESIAAACVSNRNGAGLIRRFHGAQTHRNEMLKQLASREPNAKAGRVWEPKQDGSHWGERERGQAPSRECSSIFSGLHSQIGSILLTTLLLSCTGKDVRAKVGSREITQSDLMEYSRLKSKMAGVDPLDELVKRELLANVAINKGLNKSPKVQARLKAAEREILAGAALEAELDSISDSDAKKAFEANPKLASVKQVAVAHVFFKVDSTKPDDDAQSLGRATSAWAALEGKQDFSEVAAKMSEDESTAKKGGELGVIREGEIATDLFESIAKLEPGTFTRPLKSGSGYHIFKALKPMEITSPTFDSVKAQLVAQLRKQKQTEFLETLEKQTTVKKYPDAVLSEKPVGTLEGVK